MNKNFVVRFCKIHLSTPRQVIGSSKVSGVAQAIFFYRKVNEATLEFQEKWEGRSGRFFHESLKPELQMKG